MATTRLELSAPVERGVIEALAERSGWTLVNVRADERVYATAGALALISFWPDAVEITSHDPSAIAGVIRGELACGEPREILELARAPVFPARPRLAPHVFARVHVLDGDTTVILTDHRSEAVLSISLASWRQLALADGTRDLDALRLALVKEGLYSGEDDLRGLLEPLFEAGVLIDGIDAPAGPPPVAAPETTAAERPFVVLPGYTLACDGQGGCCRSYDTVAFAPIEAMTARVLAERLSLPIHPDHMFTPLSGAELGEHTRAVAQRDGRCVFLEEDAACAIHRVAGPLAKPQGCRFYPIAFADDGAEVRVSVGPECACAYRSVGRVDGAPLVPTSARTLSDLGYSVRVVEVPDPVPLSPSRGASRAELRAWSSHLARALSERDLDAAHLAWRLADVVIDEGLSIEALERSLGRHDGPTTAAIAPFVLALRARVEPVLAMNAGWRGPRDLNRRVLEWMAPALAGDLLSRGPRDPGSERFYLRALAYGHRLAVEGRPLALGLRDRAVRILVARAMHDAGVIDDEAARYPLAVVEAAMRNLALGRYLDAIPPA